MWSKLVSVFAILLCIFFAVVRAENNEFKTIKDTLESLSNVVGKYQNEFNTRIKLAPLEDAINKIDEAMLEYQGKAKNKLNDLRTLKSDARLTYQNCVGPIYEWCVSINSTLNIFMTNIGNTNLSQSDKDIVWNLGVRVINDGIDKVSYSLEQLKEVKKKTGTLKNLLDAMLDDLQIDFCPGGYYSEQQRELTHDTGVLRTSKKANTDRAIETFFSAIQALLVGNIDEALALTPVFVSLGLTAVMQGRRQATYEEKLKIIKAFFDVLDEEIKVASIIADKVNADLEVDKNLLNSYATIRNNSPLLLNSPDLKAQLTPSFQNLGYKCYEFTKQSVRDPEREINPRSLTMPTPLQCKQPQSKYTRPSSTQSLPNEKGPVVKNVFSFTRRMI